VLVKSPTFRAAKLKAITVRDDCIDVSCCRSGETVNMANKAALVLLLVISLAGKTLHGVFVCEITKTILYSTFLRRLHTSSG